MVMMIVEYDPNKPGDYEERKKKLLNQGLLAALL